MNCCTGGCLSFQYSPGYETFFKNVYQAAACIISSTRRPKMDMQRYWIPEFSAEDKPPRSLGRQIEKKTS